jgi:hypothetical protein
MPEKTYVYAICKGSAPELYLQIAFEGTRTECNEFVKYRAENGLPTHFLEVSSLDMEAAERKFL